MCELARRANITFSITESFPTITFFTWPIIFWHARLASSIFSPSRLQSDRLHRRSSLALLALLEVEVHIACGKESRLQGAAVRPLGLARFAAPFRSPPLFRVQPW